VGATRWQVAILRTGPRTGSIGLRGILGCCYAGWGGESRK